MRLVRPGAPLSAVIIAILTALLAVPGAAFAQDTETPEDSGTAALRFMIGGKSCALYYFIDGELMAEGLHEGIVTEFMEVTAGEQVIEAYCAGEGPWMGTDGRVLKAKLQLEPGSETTLSTANGGKGPFNVSLRTIPNKPKPKVAQTQLRVVNLCQECGAVNVAGKGKPVAKDLRFKMTGKYQAVKPGEQRLVMTPKGSSVKKVRIDPFELEPGTANTLFLTMSLSDGTFTPVAVLDGEAASVLFLNASREPTVVDVYVDGRKAARKLTSRQAAPKASNMLYGEHLVQVVEAGKSVTEGLLGEATIDFPIGPTAVEVFAGDTLEAVPIVAIKAPKAETPQIRFAHVDPEIPPVSIEIEGLDPIEGLAVGAATDYITLPGESSYVWIRLASNPETIYHETPLDLTSGQNVTAYVGGSAAVPSVDFVIVVDPVAKKK